MAPLGPSTRIYYQNLPCKLGAYECPYGVASGHGFVVMPFAKFAKTVKGDPWEPHSGKGGTEEREAARTFRVGKTEGLKGTIEVRGALEFIRGGRRVVLPRIYVSDAGVEDLLRSDEAADRGLCRVPLVDVRHLWGRGDIHGEYNILKSVNGVNAPRGVQGVAIQDGDFEFRSVKPSGKAYTLLDMVRLCLARLPGALVLFENAETIQADNIIPVNMRYKAEGVAKVLSELLTAWNFRFIYDPVGDRAAIQRFSEGAPTISEEGAKTLQAAFPTLAGNVSVEPKSILFRRRLTQFFDRPKSVRVAGKPIILETEVELDLAGEINGEVRPLDECLAFHGFTREEAARWVMLPRDAQNAWQVRAPGVAGPGELPPAGPAGPRTPNSGGPEVAAGRKTSRFAVDSNFSPLQPATRGPISSEAADEMRRWAFRWAMIPRKLKGFLPIEPYRARSMVDGTRRKPVVWADTHDEIAFDLWIAKLDAELADKESRILAGLEDRKETLKKIKNTVTSEGGREDALAASYGADLERFARLGIDVKKLQDEAKDDFAKFLRDLEAAVARSESTTSEAGRKRTAYEQFLIEQIGDQLLQEISVARREHERQRQRIAPSEGVGETRIVNAKLGRMNSAKYEVSQDGVVRFNQIIGNVDVNKYRTGAPEILGQIGLSPYRMEFREVMLLQPFPSVVLLFAYKSTPASRAALAISGFAIDESAVVVRFDKSADYKDYYSFLGRLGGEKSWQGNAEVQGSQVVQLNKGGIEPDSALAEGEGRKATEYPRVIWHDLQMWQDNEGATNRSELDVFAASVVRRELEGLPQAVGGQGESGDLWALHPTGSVSSVGWEITSDAKARTRWKVGVDHLVETMQQTQIRKRPGTGGLTSGPGSVLNPLVGPP